MNKIQVGDILESESGRIAHVIGLKEDYITVLINGEKDRIINCQLYHWQYANPIKDGRIVSSKTFAIRFKNFLENIPKEWYMSQPHYLEEYEYMKNVANQLLNYQIQTASKYKEEINYLKRLELL